MLLRTQRSISGQKVSIVKRERDGYTLSQHPVPVAHSSHRLLTKTLHVEAAYSRLRISVTHSVE